jgi:general nucleoside transport system permease protein
MTLRQRKLLNAALIPVLAIISGLAFASLFIFLTPTSPLDAYRILFSAGFGCEAINRCAFLTTLERATPLILTGLSALMAFRSGMFSIGQEGQFIIGALVAAWLGYAIHLPPVLHPLVIIVLSMVGGAAYAFIPAILKTRLNVNEIISTVILNSIANLLLTYLVNFPMRASRGSTAHSPAIDQTAVLPAFLTGSQWGVGFLLAIVAVFLVWLYLWGMKGGYEQRMAGQAPAFARFGGIRSERAMIRGMLYSGALAGLAGSIEVLGVHKQILPGFASGLGFDGVMVAILGQVHPFGVMLVAILFAGVRLGAQIGMQVAANIPRELGGVILALMILFVSAREFYSDLLNIPQRLLARRRVPRVEEV